MTFIRSILIGFGISFFYIWLCPHLEVLRSTKPGDKTFSCPYCGRCLLIIHEDQKIDLAGMASAEGAAPIKGSEPTLITEKDMTFTDAECMRPVCRIRAWWSKRKARE